MITIKGFLPLDDKWQWVYLDVDSQPFTHIAPAGLEGDDLQAYVDSQEAFYLDELAKNAADGVVYEHPEPIPGSPQAKLAKSDSVMIRAIDDLIDILKAKGVISDIDLPREVRDQKAAREAFRAQLAAK